MNLDVVVVCINPKNGVHDRNKPKVLQYKSYNMLKQ